MQGYRADESVSLRPLRQLLSFENTHCVRCGQLVAYLPDLAIVGSLDKDPNKALDKDRERETPT